MLIPVAGAGVIVRVLLPMPMILREPSLRFVLWIRMIHESVRDVVLKNTQASALRAVHRLVADSLLDRR